MYYNNLETGEIKEMKGKTDTWIKEKPDDRCNRHHATTMIISFFPSSFCFTYFLLLYISTFHFVYFSLQNTVHLFPVPFFCLVLPSFSLRFFICSTHFAFLFRLIFFTALFHLFHFLLQHFLAIFVSSFLFFPSFLTY